MEITAKNISMRLRLSPRLALSVMSLLSLDSLGHAQNLYVASSGTNPVLNYNGSTGASLGAFVTAGSGGLNSPSGGITFGPDGNLYVASIDNSVLKYNGSTGASLGAFVTAGSGGLHDPLGITFGPDGNLYVASFSTSQVLKYNGSTGAS